MSKELAQELDPIEKEEPEEVVQESPEKPQEPAQEAETVETEGEVEEKPAKPPKGFVPQGALHEERERRKEATRQLQEFQRQQAEKEQRFEQRLNAIQQAAWQAQQPKPPSFEEDPVAALKHGVDSTQEELRQLRQWQQQESERIDRENQQRNFVQRLESTVHQDVNAFRKETPDYDEALTHARTARFKQHLALGMSEDEATQTVLSEEYQLAHEALQRGQSPAKAVYEIAKAYGYTKKAPNQEGQQKIETLQKGVKAASSLGSGGTPTGKLTVDAVANMSDDEFADFMKAGGWNKLG